jgi:hypothetical protein
VKNRSIDDSERPPLAVVQEAYMAENEKEAYLALIAAHDPEIGYFWETHPKGKITVLVTP